MYNVNYVIFFSPQETTITNPNREFDCIAINGYLLGFIIHSDCALHIFAEFIFGEPQEYTGNDIAP